MALAQRLDGAAPSVRSPAQAPAAQSSHISRPKRSMGDNVMIETNTVR
jgi:hypothetical protein